MLLQKLFEPILSLWIPSSFSQFGHGSSGWTTEQYIHILFLWTTWITAIFKPHFWLHSRNNLVRRGKKGKRESSILEVDPSLWKLGCRKTANLIFHRGFDSCSRKFFFYINLFQVQHVHLEEHHILRKRSIDQNLRIKLYYDDSVYK